MVVVLWAAADTGDVRVWEPASINQAYDATVKQADLLVWERGP